MWEMVLAFAAIGTLLVTILRFRPRYALRWAILPPKSMMEIAEDIAPSVAIYYADRRVSNLIRYQFILHNRGSSLFERDAIIDPITWRGPGQILSAKIVATEPPVELQLDIDGSTLKISWALFNQKCKAVIEVLCEGSTANNSSIDQRGSISGQIKNIPVIKEKQIWWRDEDEILRRMEANLARQSHRAQKFKKIFVNRWILRITPWILLGYVALLPFIFVRLVLDALNISLVISTVAAIFSAALVALLLYLWFRNPYASILRKARADKATAKTTVPDK